MLGTPRGGSWQERGWGEPRPSLGWGTHCVSLANPEPAGRASLRPAAAAFPQLSAGDVPGPGDVTWPKPAPTPARPRRLLDLWGTAASLASLPTRGTLTQTRHVWAKAARGRCGEPGRGAVPVTARSSRLPAQLPAAATQQSPPSQELAAAPPSAGGPSSAPAQLPPPPDSHLRAPPAGALCHRPGPGTEIHRPIHVGRGTGEGGPRGGGEEGEGGEEEEEEKEEEEEEEEEKEEEKEEEEGRPCRLAQDFGKQLFSLRAGAALASAALPPQPCGVTCPGQMAGPSALLEDRLGGMGVGGGGMGAGEGDGSGGGGPPRRPMCYCFSKRDICSMSFFWGGGGELSGLLRVTQLLSVKHLPPGPPNSRATSSPHYEHLLSTYYEPVRPKGTEGAAGGTDRAAWGGLLTDSPLPKLSLGWGWALGAAGGGGCKRSSLHSPWVVFGNGARREQKGEGQAWAGVPERGRAAGGHFGETQTVPRSSAHPQARLTLPGRHPWALRTLSKSINTNYAPTACQTMNHHLLG
ncbi:uncharacterized protein ACOB8E_004951 [Sarcophilus harrisii]